MPRFILTLAYEGAPFVGWQRQAAGVSIQGLLEDILSVLDHREVMVEGAGRTDAGVHALAQTATVSLSRDLDARTVWRALNAHLPETVRVLSVEPAAAAFHARFSAVAKTYRYRIWNHPVLVPFERAYTWHIPGPRLDIDAMRKAAEYLHGRHDYASFTGTGARTRTTDREIFGSTVARGAGIGVDDAMVTYDVWGSGFLKHMVRNIVGTLVEVGHGKRQPDSMPGLLDSRSRGLAGRTAPACGLFLVRVHYDRPDL